MIGLLDAGKRPTAGVGRVLRVQAMRALNRSVSIGDSSRLGIALICQRWSTAAQNQDGLTSPDRLVAPLFLRLSVFR